LDPDYVSSLVCGQSGTSMKDQGSHFLASEYEEQRTCFKAQKHWGRKGSKPIITPLCALICICIKHAFYYLSTSSSVLMSKLNKSKIKSTAGERN